MEASRLLHGHVRRVMISSMQSPSSPEDAVRGAHRVDLELVRAARAGSLDARRQFAVRMRCVPRMLAALNARMGRPLSAQDLEDLVQDALVVVWKGLPTYGGMSTLETWVYRCCSRELLAKLRERDRLPDPVADPSGELGTLSEPQTFQEVYDALQRLDAKERAVIELKHFDELTFEAIGERLAMSPNTAKAWYYRGLEELKRILAPSVREQLR